MDTHRTIELRAFDAILKCFGRAAQTRTVHRSFAAPLSMSTVYVKKIQNNLSFGGYPCYWFSQFNNATAGGTEKFKCFCGQATTNLPSPISPAPNPPPLILPFQSLPLLSGQIDYFCTVSWRIRILNCIEEVPLVHFSIQCKFKLEFFSWFQLEFKLRIAVETQRPV